MEYTDMAESLAEQADQALVECKRGVIKLNAGVRESEKEALVERCLKNIEELKNIYDLVSGCQFESELFYALFPYKWGYIDKLKSKIESL